LRSIILFNPTIAVLEAHCKRQGAEDRRPEAGGRQRTPSGGKRDFDLERESPRFRDGLAVFRHAIEVKFDGLSNVVRDSLDGLSGGDATRQIRDVGVVPSELQVHNLGRHRPW